MTSPAIRSVEHDRLSSSSMRITSIYTVHYKRGAVIDVMLQVHSSRAGQNAKIENSYAKVIRTSFHAQLFSSACTKFTMFRGYNIAYLQHGGGNYCGQDDVTGTPCTDTSDSVVMLIDRSYGRPTFMLCHHSAVFEDRQYHRWRERTGRPPRRGLIDRQWPQLLYRCYVREFYMRLHLRV